jgi:DNA-binding response OmpR family regulator
MTSDFQPSGQFRPVNERFLRKGPFVLDLVDHCVTINHKTIQLPICAFESLVLLVQSSPKPVSFQDLAQTSPGNNLSKVDIQDKARLHIYILKKAFEQNLESRYRIKAVPGYGYWIRTF